MIKQGSQTHISLKKKTVPQDLIGLWQQRAQALFTEIGKYGRLIVNDHFSIILLVLLAFLGIYYQEILSLYQKAEFLVWREPLRIVFTLMLVLASQVGGPIWLTLAPDEAYLFSQGKKWQEFWLKGTLLGLVLPILLTAILAGLVFPFALRISDWTLNQWPLFVSMIAIVTGLNIFSRLYDVLHQPGIRRPIRWLLSAVIIFLLFQLPYSWNLLIPLALALVWAVYLYLGLRGQARTRLQFDRVVELEQHRRSVFYKWIAVFADVPKLQPAVKRRAYLDRIIQALPFFNRQAYSYLLIRLLFRHGAYSGVWLKVTGFIAFLLLWLRPWWLVLGLGVLGQWMTVVQLLPLRTYPQDQVFFRLYPEKGDGLATFQRMIATLLIAQTLVFALCTQQLLAIVGWLISVVVLTYLYLPWQVRKARSKY